MSISFPGKYVIVIIEVIIVIMNLKCFLMKLANNYYLSLFCGLFCSIVFLYYVSSGVNNLPRTISEILIWVFVVNLTRLYFGKSHVKNGDEEIETMGNTAADTILDDKKSDDC